MPEDIWGGKSSGPTPHSTVSAPSASTGNMLSVDKNWTRRLPQLYKMGYNFNSHIAPVIAYDKQRVGQGTTPLGNAEAMDLLKSVKTGHDPMLQGGTHHSDILGIPGTSILGNAVGDIASITGGLFKLPGLLIKDTPKFFSDLAHGMPEWKSPSTSSGLPDFGKIFSELQQTPLVREFLPGVTTGYNITHGKEAQFAGQHPIMALLDVLPYASTFSKVATAGIEPAEAGSIVSALKDGQPLRAASRLPMIPSKTGLRSPSQLVHAYAQKSGLSSEIRAAAQMLEQHMRTPTDQLAQTQWDALAKLRDQYNTTVQQFRKESSVGLLHKWEPSEKQLRVLDDLRKRIDDASQAIHEYAIRDWIVGLMGSKLDMSLARKFGQTFAQAKTETQDAMAHGLYGKENKYSPEFTAQHIKRYDDIQKLQEDARAKLFAAEHAEAQGLKGEAARNIIAAKASNKRAGRLVGADPLRRFGDNKTRTTFNNTKVPLFGQSAHGRTIQKGFVDNFGLSAETKAQLKAEIQGIYGESNLYIPKWFDNAFARDQKLGQMLKQSGPLRIFDKSTEAFKYATLTGPRHLVHIFSSNIVMALLEKPEAPFTLVRDNGWARMIDMLRDPQKWAAAIPGMPRGMQLYKADNPYEIMDVNVIGSMAQGKSMGRIALEKYGGAPVRMFKSWENWIVDFTRAMLFVSQHDKIIRQGGLESDAVKAGEQLVYKTLMNTDNMAPIERTIMRRVMPFYPFTRQLLRFMGRYPQDHPYRAAVLSTIGRIEMTDQSTDLPFKMDSLFFLGSPDNSGNVQAIDMKNWNPFRSMEGNNPFTLAGFLSMFHPAVQALMKLSGGTPLSATPEMFPELTVDQYTGNLVAQHQNVPLTLGETFLPPTQAIDQLLNLSGQFRSLQQESGKGGTDVWRKTLFSFLNIPFVPFNVNLKTEEAKFAAHWFSVSKQDLKNALAGDSSELGQFRELPITEGTGFQSHSGFITPQKLENEMQRLQQMGAS